MAKYRSYVESATSREVNRARATELARLRASGQTAAALSPSPQYSAATFAQMVQQPHNDRYVLVRFKSASASIDALASLGYAHEKSLPLVAGLRRLRVPDGIAMQDILEQLNALDAVAYAEPDYEILPVAVPNDPQVDGANAWWLQQIRAYAAWDVATDASAIGPISVFDNGVDVSHEDLSQNLWVNTGETPGDGIDNDNNGYVDDINGITTLAGSQGHGTPVAGTICGQGNNGLGSAGSAWRCQIMNIQSIGGFDNTVAAVVEGFAYAVANGSRISNHSWRVFVYSQALADVVTQVQQSGHLVIAAAGNENNDIDAQNVNFPARLPNDNVITIAASTQGDGRISYSSYGPVSVDLASPTEFVSTFPGDAYQGFSGTSQATPVVAGAVALAWAQTPSWTYLEMRQHLLDNVRPVAAWSGLTVTGGILDMQAMMENLNQDTDGDGLNDDVDPDDDNDGVLDGDDAFPRDPKESVDTDGDGIGNNADADDDNDGVDDEDDLFPLNPDESADHDGDGTGDNADTDDDNDGIADGSEGGGVTNGYADDFESNLGWSNNPDNNDTATTGVWQVANPEQTTNGAIILQRDDTTSGVQALVTQAAAGSGLGDFDIDNGKTSTLSPEIVLGSGSATLSFNYYLAHLDNATADDYLRVSVRSGANTVNVLNERGVGTDRAGAWTPFSVDISQFAGSTIQILVEAADAGTPSLVEAAIDDLAISGSSNDDDGDGIPPSRDLDSDNDGLWDSVEAGATDADNDGLVDDPADRGSITTPADSDGDGIPNHLDLESNNAANDGTDYDVVASGNASFDTNGDGRINIDDSNGGVDADSDGIDDLIDSDPTTPGSPGGGGGDVRLSIGNVSVDEAAGSATLEVTLSAVASRAITVTAFTRAPGSTATPGADYFGTTQTLSFAAGESSQSVSVIILDDTETEGSETIAVRLVNAVGAIIEDNEGVITIDDNDSGGGLPELTVQDLTVAEDVGVAQVQVLLSQAPSAAVSVTVFTRPTGTAAPGEDFFGNTQVLEFAAGETTKSINIGIIDDTAPESDESLDVRLADATGATITDAVAILSITDNDGGGAAAVLAVKDQSFSEDIGVASVTVTLTPAATVPVSVLAFTRATGSAQPGQDLYGKSETLEFAVGETTKTFDIPIINDTEVDPSETFEVRLANADGADIGSAIGTITIDDDDGSSGGASLSINSVTVNESDGTASVIITLSSAVAAKVTAFTRAGTANGGGEDFIGFTREFNFNPGGATARLMTVQLIDDDVAEGTETMTVRLTDASGADIAVADGVITIEDDD